MTDATPVTPVTVPDDFEEEFPGSSRSAAEVAANLVRTADAFLTEVQRRRRAVADLSPSAFQALAVLEGADGPLTSQQIADSLLVSSASMTSLLDTLERRDLVVRRSHPDDRRKILVDLTHEARSIVDRMLPTVHAAATEAIAGLSERDRARMLVMLTSVRSQLSAMATEQPEVPPARRHRARRRLP
jgi:DNA-binding MarR family transcriptional regulator